MVVWEPVGRGVSWRRAQSTEWRVTETSMRSMGTAALDSMASRSLVRAVWVSWRGGSQSAAGRRRKEKGRNGDPECKSPFWKVWLWKNRIVATEVHGSQKKLVADAVVVCVFFFKFKCIYFNWRLITLQYYIGFAIHQHESVTGCGCFKKAEVWACFQVKRNDPGEREGVTDN